MIALIAASAIMALAATGVAIEDSAPNERRCITTLTFPLLFDPELRRIDTIPANSSRAVAMLPAAAGSRSGDWLVIVFATEDGERVAGLWRGGCMDIELGPFTPL